ncbi:PASTA domain-containing protein [Ilyomonas limi]|uniref:PASTA domain-containing protein n=1 Tax=Ilyomonas limi TaxID=2575867 RepID=A0A4U3KSF6_9BACT|nr:PASTA domain-containing protein [Ilyomonas limi]
MEVKRDILWRVYLCFIAIILVCVVVMSKAFYIQQVQGEHWRGMSDSMHQKIVELDAERGTIYSEDGQMLSTSIPQFDIYVDFGAEGLRDKSGKLFRQNLDSLSYCLSNLFKDKSGSAYKKILSNGYAKKTRYFLLKRKISFKEYQQLRQFPLVRLGRNKSGFIAEVRSIRLNPYQLLAYRTIGLNRENAQKIGLEQTYDSVLKGTTGKRLVRYIGGGVSVPVDGALDIEPENGKDVITTLNVHIQEIAENALMNMMQQSESQTGTCIVMETKTGKIRAMANLGRRPDGSYWEDYNYAMRATEPGSTIKLATLLAVLSEGKTSINDVVKVGNTGTAFVGVREVTDAERSPKPVMTVAECFAHSSNIGMSEIAYNTFAQQPDKFMKYLHQFRLDTITGIDLLGESKPRLPRMNRRNEGLHAMVTMSFGYAIQISPLQTLTLYNAIANGGKMMKPYLVNSIQNDGTIIKQYGPTVLRESICKPGIVKAAQQCMLAVTAFGTGKPIFKDCPYKVAGKTGTAHVADGKYGYNDGVYQASFVGYFPADNPQFTCIVAIKTKPYAPLHFGGQLAAPVFKEISDRLYSMYVQHSDSIRYATDIVNDSIGYNYIGMKTDVSEVMNALDIPFKASSTNSDWISVYKNGKAPAVAGKTMPASVMPSLQGMGLKDAVYLCENMGLKVRVKGAGKVTTQSISSGNKISKGQVVSIELN